MSLINDALKKAQRQRTPDAGVRHSAPDPAPSPPPAAQPYVYVRPVRSSGIDPSLLKLGAIGGGAVIVILAGVLIWKSSGSNEAPKTPPAHSQPATTAAAAPTGTAQSQPATTVPAPVPVITAPAPATQPPAQFTIRSEAPASAPASVAANPPVATPPATVATPAAGETPKISATKPDPRVLVAIDGFKILGVRIGAAGKESKVLMNDRVYRLGDYVLPEFGLKLTGVTSSTLTFEDSSGALYTKSF
jgi:hypothetical protein